MLLFGQEYTQMRNRFVLTFGVLAFLALLSGCPSPSGNNNNAIVGTWTLSTETVSGKTVSVSGLASGTIVFTSSNTFTEILTVSGITSTFSGTWNASGSTYTLNVTSPSTSTLTASISGTSLTLVLNSSQSYGFAYSSSSTAPPIAPPPDPIVGTWTLATLNGVPVTTSGDSGSLVFTSSGTISGTQTIPPSSAITISGTWTVSGGTYTLIATSPSPMTLTGTIGGTTLTLVDTSNPPNSEILTKN